METDDPRAALTSPDVATRAAGVRDLALVGAWDDVATLVRLAVEDKSPAVRLYAAASAADVLSRRRGTASQVPLDDAERAQVHAWVKGIDPERNPGMLMLLSAVADRAAIDRLGRNLTKSADSGVRGGAAMALRRMALSAGPLDTAWLEESARKWVSGKVPPDVTVEVAKLAGERGLAGFDALIATLAAGTKAQAAAAEVASQQIARRRGVDGWDGIYETDGRDVVESATSPRWSAWAALTDGVWYAPIEGGGAELPAKKKRALVPIPRAGLPVQRIGEQATIGGAPARLVFAPRPGQPDLRAPGVQVGGVHWWKREGKALADWVEAHLDEIEDPIRGAVAGWLAKEEGAAIERARAVLLWRSGDAEGARRLLDHQVATKKPRADVYLLLGQICAELGDKPAARSALDQFLEKSGKKAEGRDEAEALRKKLG